MAVSRMRNRKKCNIGYIAIIIMAQSSNFYRNTSIIVDLAMGHTTFHRTYISSFIQVFG